MDAPRRPGRQWGTLVASVAAGLLVAACAAPAERPSATPVASAGRAAPSPSAAVPASTPVPGTVSPSPAADLAALPAPPGGVETGRVVERDGGWSELTVTYRTAEPLDTVRVHYRRALRTGNWRITDVDIDSASAGWEIEAVRGAREVEIELIADGTVTLVSVTESAPAS
jgi:hypothetical protein